MSLGNFREASREYIFSVSLFLNDFITLHQYITSRVKRQALYSSHSIDIDSFHSILVAVGEDIISHISLGLVDSEVSFAEDICFEVE